MMMGRGLEADIAEGEEGDAAIITITHKRPGMNTRSPLVPRRTMRGRTIIPVADAGAAVVPRSGTPTRTRTRHHHRTLELYRTDVMRTSLECIPCFIRQAVEVARRFTEDTGRQERILRQSLELAMRWNFNQEPPRLGREMHRLLKETTGVADPYRRLKAESNEIALRLYPGMQRDVLLATAPFEAAVRFAIAGNIIDFGCRSEVNCAEIENAIAEAMTARIDRHALRVFRAAVERAERILYLADNAGELVFDRLLIEQLPRRAVTLAVRGQPIINDATREDARLVGLTSLVRVIDNGSDVPGTVPDLCSRTFRRHFAQSDLIISKGQGNFETLEGRREPIIFLLRAKCAVVADRLGCDINDMVIDTTGLGAAIGGSRRGQCTPEDSPR